MNKLIGTKITSIQDGKTVSTVKDVVFDPSEDKITALIVKEKSLLSDTYVIPFSSIQNVGEDRVMIPTKFDIKKASDVPESISYIAKNNVYLMESRIITEDGQNLGYVTDVFFDSDTGVVKELEVTERTKLLNRVVSKRIIKVSDIVTVGKQATIVRSVPEVKQEAAPLQKKPAEQSEKQSPASVNQEWKRITFTDDYIKFIEDKLKNEEKLTDQDIDQYKNFVDQAKQQEIVGMYLTKNILLENDNFFAQSGELITHKMLDEAKKNNVYDQIVHNASSLPPELDMQVKLSSNPPLNQ